MKQRRSAQNPNETLWRSLKTLSITRVLIALILLILLGLNNSKYIWSIDPHLYRDICLIYIFGGLGFVALQTQLKQYFLWQLSAQVTFDVLVISVLYFFAGGINSSLVILYLFPLASCAILAPLIWALFLASVVALYLLLGSSFQVLQTGSEIAVSSSGLYGAAFLAIVYAVNRLANRLIRQEELAREHGKNLRIQQEINKLVVADMGDGIIVVDSTSRVYASNPATKQMLGITIIPGVSKLSEMPSLLPIADAFYSWRKQVPDIDPVWADTIAFAAVDLHDDSTISDSVMVKGVRRDVVTHLKLRFVNVNAEFGASDERCIIFLQDAFEIENQAQQLKLASMGRLTASIAHEVRNPLSSISYAAALLGESDISPEQGLRLVKIVNDNVVRLNQLIEDILRLSRKAQINVEPFLLKPAVQEILQEFQETHGLAPEVIHLSAPDAMMIRFDPLHLREVLVNLLTNAIRYASGAVSSIQLFVVADLADQLELHVRDDGPGITAEVRAHLFEPFYTTSSRGTGLGLYMARELCLNNGALLDYEYRVTELGVNNANTKANGRFVITFVKPK
ncbi:sensor histidine kinase [Solimicrobium silvestre]|uniref:histidine kinase n=1 Tax=Solimicrobium silvestre TaxID=2099400 RepID=A0A2S9GUI6_9BURK|nr:ATP-binding protein [Solimicrobium silvestre]PRC91380.1 His Kinase A (phospho-acceptor) domain [Solimicrobium silvestre]